MVQVVFMTENAASMPETVAYMADAGVQTVNVIQMIDTNGRSGFLDATLHFSSEYLEWIKQQCVEIAREKRIRLGWDLDGAELVRLPRAGHEGAGAAQQDRGTTTSTSR